MDNTDNRKCINCKHVRKACNEKYIACGYISAVKRGLITVPPVIVQDFYGDLHVKEVDFDTWFGSKVEFDNEHEVYEGWACLTVKPDKKNKGLISNYCVITSRENCCNLWESEDGYI